MIYLANVTLINDTKDKITSEIVLTQESLDNSELTSYQFQRALGNAGITRKTKTKWDKWVNARLFQVQVIKEIKGIS